jgi:hypothetical protein
MKGTAPLPRCLRTGSRRPSAFALRRESLRRQAARQGPSCKALHSILPLGRLRAKDRTKFAAPASNGLCRTIAVYPADGIANRTPQT